MSGNKPSICIVILVGIPASGKSHFRQCLTEWFGCNRNNTSTTDLVCRSELKNIYVVPVSYDDYIGDQYVNDEDSNHWKIKRTEICNSVENLLNMLKGNDSQSDCLLSDVLNMNIAVQSSSVVFVIDDNMYYQSMRYQYYKLARKYNTGFCQFYLKARLKDALHYNSLRNENIVSESTIIKMFSKLEPPDTNNRWEELSLEIDSFTDFNKMSSLESVTNIIVQCLKNPVVPVTDIDENTKKEAREITNSNTLHQIDLILRRIVGEQVKEASIALVNKNNLKQVSQLFCNKRQVLLQKIKRGEITLPFPSSVFQKSAQDDIEVVKQFLSQLI